MEKGKQVFGSSSSFTNDLFGPKEPSNTSLFGSLFGPHSTGLGRDSTHSAARVSSRIQDPGNQSYGIAKYGTSDNINGSLRSRGEISNKDKNNSILYQNGTTEPCHFSSSIYYGGQDAYYPPTTSHNTLKKNGQDDDDDQNGNNSGCASRGNWWQGSLYY